MTKYEEAKKHTTPNFEVRMGKKKNAFANYANIPIIKVRKASEVNGHFMFTFA